MDRLTRLAIRFVASALATALGGCQILLEEAKSMFSQSRAAHDRVRREGAGESVEQEGKALG